MQAAFCAEPGKIELREVAPPQPGAGQVLVKVRSCGICGSDLHYYHGGLPPPVVCPGHEISGEVAEVGAGVTRFAAGDRVAVEPAITCGRCPGCRVGDYQLCREFKIVGTHADGGFAEYLVMPEYALFALPAGVAWPVAALTEPLAVGVHGVRLGNVRLGDRVLVLGAGTIGLLAALAAREAGAAEVLITARHPHQRRAAERFGARPFAEERDELSAYVFAHPVDVTIETVGGRAETLNQALYSTRPGGRVVVLGVFTTQPQLNALVLMLKEMRLIGSLMYGRDGVRADFDVALDVLQRNAAAAAEMVTHRFPLAQIAEAYRVAADKRQKSIKVTIEP
jgi:2-desacetyl-2-hydroxyethyl bacteriochlorophyllide A dehydrogenase